MYIHFKNFKILKNGNSDVNVIIIGNKCDIKDKRVVNTELINNVFKNLKI